MKSETDAVRDFVVDVLGCRCPEEAFLDIRLNKAPEPVGDVPLLFDIRVGGRLLIFGVASDHLRRPDALAMLVAAGKKTRDNHKFNRFRLVVVTDGAVAGNGLRGDFAVLPMVDDRIHLHVVAKGGVRGFIED